MTFPAQLSNVERISGENPSGLPGKTEHLTGQKAAELFGQKLFVRRSFTGCLLQKHAHHPIGAEAEKGLKICSSNGSAAELPAEELL